MKVDEVYRRFKIATTQYDTPPRFGYDWFTEATNKLWDAAENPKYRPQAVDWMGFEAFTRDVLESDQLSDTQKVTLLKEAVGAFTGRGTVN